MADAAPAQSSGFRGGFSAEVEVVAVHVVAAVVVNAVVVVKANPRNGNQSPNWDDWSKMVRSNLWKKSTLLPFQSRNSKLSIISLAHN